MPVFFIQSEDVVGEVITITDPLLTHISKSLRKKLGDSLVCNDSQGHRYQTIVTQMTKTSLQARIQQIETSPRPTSPPLILVQALLKGEKMGWVIQKATELGVSTIIPLITDRIIIKLTGKQEDSHQARWKRIALEAAQQSERWTLPNILPMQTFQQFLDTTQLDSPIFLGEREESPSLLTVPCSTESQKTGVTVMVGPEGGWSVDEIETAKTHNYPFASFGKEILRAETASLAALAILQARFKIKNE